MAFVEKEIYISIMCFCFFARQIGDAWLSKMNRATKEQRSLIQRNDMHLRWLKRVAKEVAVSICYDRVSRTFVLSPFSKASSSFISHASNTIV